METMAVTEIPETNAEVQHDNGDDGGEDKFGRAPGLQRARFPSIVCDKLCCCSNIKKVFFS
jgi:hypothetical protein